MIERRNGRINVSGFRVEVGSPQPFAVSVHEAGLVFARAHQVTAVKGIGSGNLRILGGIGVIVDFQIGAGQQEGGSLGIDVIEVVGSTDVLISILQVTDNLVQRFLQVRTGHHQGVVGTGGSQSEEQSLSVVASVLRIVVGGTIKAVQVQEIPSAHAMCLRHQVLTPGRQFLCVRNQHVAVTDGRIGLHPHIRRIGTPPTVHHRRILRVVISIHQPLVRGIAEVTVRYLDVISHHLLGNLSDGQVMEMFRSGIGTHQHRLGVFIRGHHCLVRQRGTGILIKFIIRTSRSQGQQARQKQIFSFHTGFYRL